MAITIQLGGQEMYKCGNCGYEFNEPTEVKTSYEQIYGVNYMFDNKTPTTVQVCPYCGSDSWYEKQIEDDDVNNSK